MHKPAERVSAGEKHAFVLHSSDEADEDGVAASVPGDATNKRGRSPQKPGAFTADEPVW